jgi:hypothetical protein
MTKTAEWITVMEGLRGRRLAVLDDLERGEPVNVADPKVQEILGWLVYHRFIWHDGRGYVVRTTPQARDLYLEHGGASDSAMAVTYLQHGNPAPAAAPEINPNRPAVHAHQAQLFQ